MQPTDSEVYFREVQRFTQWWVWLMVLGIAALMWYAFVGQIILGRPFGDNPAPAGLLIAFTALFGIGLPWLFIVAALYTEVRAGAVYMRFFPFHLKWIRIGPEVITSHSAGTYNPLLDYGGWGIHSGRDGRAYNTSGNQGVRIELADGSNIMIGSQRAGEFAAAVEKMLAAQREN